VNVIRDRMSLAWGTVNPIRVAFTCGQHLARTKRSLESEGAGESLALASTLSDRRSFPPWRRAGEYRMADHDTADMRTLELMLLPNEAR